MTGTNRGVTTVRVCLSSSVLPMHTFIQLGGWLESQFKPTLFMSNRPLSKEGPSAAPVSTVSAIVRVDVFCFELGCAILVPK